MDIIWASIRAFYLVWQRYWMLTALGKGREGLIEVRSATYQLTSLVCLENFLIVLA